MGLNRMGPPRELVTRIRDAYNVRHFVETGTYEGYTARWAASCFDRVTTFECAHTLYEKARTRWARLTNIEFMLGDSRAGLTALMPRLEQPAVFWLDAHWSGGETHGEADPCPLLGELATVLEAPVAHFVLIDDARLFAAPPPPPHRPEAWPQLQDVSEAIHQSPHAFSVEILEDVIVAVPVAAREVVAAYRDQHTLPHISIKRSDVHSDRALPCQ